MADQLTEEDPENVPPDWVDWNNLLNRLYIKGENQTTTIKLKLEQEEISVLAEFWAGQEDRIVAEDNLDPRQSALIEQGWENRKFEHFIPKFYNGTIIIEMYHCHVLLQICDFWKCHEAGRIIIKGFDNSVRIACERHYADVLILCAKIQVKYPMCTKLGVKLFQMDQEQLEEITQKLKTYGQMEYLIK